jgi:flagellar hook-basal body complex protein FliE
MNDVRVSELLDQMRALRLQAQGQAGAPGAPAPAAGNGFGELLRNSIDAVNGNQRQARELQQAFETGDKRVDLSEVMVAMQKASLSFQAMTQVRNKLVEAYREVMGMAL